LAGGASAAAVSGWLRPALLGLSLALLGRSFYVLYVRKRGSRASAVLTWFALVLVVGFWAWRLV
jgi:hypothetical protein